MTRLLSINSYHYRRGGSDVVYLDHAALMESIGWENAFFSMRFPANIPSEWSKYFVDEIQYGHDYSFTDKVIKATKVVYSFEAQRKIGQLIDAFAPDIAHTHCIYHHLSPSILPVLRAKGVPVVMTAHELKVLCPAYKMLNSKGVCERCKDGNVLNVLRYRCIKESFMPSALVAIESLVHRGLNIYKKHINKVVTPSRFYYEKYQEWGWPRAQLAYVPNYVDAARFFPSYEPGRHALYFGRLAPEKGVDTLIHAANKADVHLKIAGTGPEEARLKALAGSLNADVEFMGFRGGEQLHDIIRSARVVVLPSEWYENAPMSVLESFALGKPVVGARIGGIPEMIEPGQNGWIFESGDVEHLAETLREASSTDNSWLIEMGRNSRLGVERHFNRERYLREILAVYAEVGVNV
ncbi:MAG: glycosyl transferase [Rhodocyclaceae bacterium UTPRO2]|jgi:glycosyltransferase involved in cell wall biosynthesis|nr:MAG: glycosyl transferase [Rhodocyclaceae bacterium UTPRO2]